MQPWQTFIKQLYISAICQNCIKRLIQWYNFKAGLCEKIAHIIVIYIFNIYAQKGSTGTRYNSQNTQDQTRKRKIYARKTVFSAICTNNRLPGTCQLCKINKIQKVGDFFRKRAWRRGYFLLCYSHNQTTQRNPPSLKVPAIASPSLQSRRLWNNAKFKACDKDKQALARKQVRQNSFCILTSE